MFLRTNALKSRARRRSPASLQSRPRTTKPCVEQLEDRRLLAAQPTITIDDVQQLEGDDSTSSFIFTVTRSGNRNQASTVDFATADGSATEEVDYESSSGTLEFAPGERSKMIAVTVYGDSESEANEDFFVNLSNPTGATIPEDDDQGKGTIVNDDDGLPAQGAIYVYSLDYKTRQHGKNTEIQFTIDVRIDSDGDSEAEESDAPANGVLVLLSLYDSDVTELNGESNIRNFLGELDDGSGSTYWYKLPGPGDYYVEVHDISLEGHEWDTTIASVPPAELGDDDDDGRPDLMFSVYSTDSASTFEAGGLLRADGHSSLLGFASNDDASEAEGCRKAVTDTEWVALGDHRLSHRLEVPLSTRDEQDQGEDLVADFDAKLLEDNLVQLLATEQSGR